MDSNKKSKPGQFLEEEAQFTGDYHTSLFETLYLAYKPYRANYLALTSVGLLARLFIMSNANLIGYWVDSFCTAPNCKHLPSFMTSWTSYEFICALGALCVVGLCLTMIFRIGFSRISAKAISQLYDEVTMRTSRFPMSFFDAHPTGRIITRFSSDYGNVFRMFGGPLSEFLGIIFDLVSMLILITVASPYYLILCVLIGVCNYLVYRLNRPRLRHERRQSSAIRSPSIAHFAETTQGASTIRAFLKQPSFFRRFRGLNNLFLQQKLRTSRALIVFSLQMTSLSALLLLLTSVLGLWLASRGLVTIGSIGVAFSFITMSGNTMQLFFEWMTQFEEALVGVERLDRYLRHPLEQGLRLPSSAQFETAQARYSADEEATLAGSKILCKTAASLELKNVWFRYRENLPFVLKGVNLRLEAGEKLGVVGRTGSGKTSLIQALFHLYPIHSGEITIDGFAPEVGRPVAAAEIELNIYRRAIALISQDPVLLSGTLRDNLDLDGVRTDAELLAVLNRVGLTSWLAEHPRGLMHAIEERGRNLSLGEKQLICMARCLLQDSPLIVMDEATSAVDPQSEEIMVRATEDFFSDRTQIIVAHRLSSLRHCDRILWLQDGIVQMLDRPEVVLPIFSRAHLT